MLNCYPTSGTTLTCSFYSAGMIDCPGTQDGSSLRSLIDKPPVCGNSFSPLTGALLTGFRLHTGPVLTNGYYKWRYIISSHIVQSSTYMNVYVCYFSSQNSTDWCTYSLQRRRANTSTSIIDHRTHYHKVGRAISTNTDTQQYDMLSSRWPFFWCHRNSIRLWSQEEEKEERRRPRPQEKEERQEKEKGKKSIKASVIHNISTWWWYETQWTHELR